MAQTLLERGCADVRALVGGFDAWRKAGYPLEAKPTETTKPADRNQRVREMQENLQKAEGHESSDA